MDQIIKQARLIGKKEKEVKMQRRSSSLVPFSFGKRV